MTRTDLGSLVTVCLIGICAACLIGVFARRTFFYSTEPRATVIAANWAVDAQGSKGQLIRPATDSAKKFSHTEGAPPISGAFPDAFQMMVDPYFNPALSSASQQQLDRLQRVIDEANSLCSALDAEMRSMIEAEADRAFAGGDSVVLVNGRGGKSSRPGLCTVVKVVGDVARIVEVDPSTMSDYKSLIDARGEIYLQYRVQCVDLINSFSSVAKG